MSPTTKAPKHLRTFRLSPETLRQIKDLAERQGRTEAEVLAVAMDRMYHTDYPTPQSVPLTHKNIEVDIYEWHNQMLAGLDSLNLPAFCGNRLLGACQVWDQISKDNQLVPSKPYIAQPGVFTLYGQLLTFDNWCLQVLDGKMDQNLIVLRNWGEKSLKVLKDAIRALTATPPQLPTGAAAHLPKGKGTTK